MAEQKPNGRIGTPELIETFENNDPLEVMRSVVTDYERDIVAGSTIPTHSNILELMSETSPEDAKQGLDAFTRIIRHLGIPLSFDGRFIATDVEGFFNGNGEDGFRRLLYNEYLQRAYRSVAMPTTRSTYLAGDSLPGSWLLPYAEAMQARQDSLFSPAIPLNSIVAFTTPITGNAYRAFYFERDTEGTQTRRIGESADIPLLKISKREHEVRTLKYGFALEASYEVMRYERVDRLARNVQMVAAQDEADKVEQAMSVLINGDGNIGTAAEIVTASAIDPDFVAEGLSIATWLAMTLEYDNPYMLTHALMQKVTALGFILMDSRTANVPLANIPDFAGLRPQSRTPINTTSTGVNYGWLNSAPTDQIVTFDGGKAIEHIVEIGSEIAETDRFIRNQTQLLTFSANHGFMLSQPGSNKILDLQ